MYIYIYTHIYIYIYVYINIYIYILYTYIYIYTHIHITYICSPVHPNSIANVLGVRPRGLSDRCGELPGRRRPSMGRRSDDMGWGWDNYMYIDGIYIYIHMGILRPYVCNNPNSDNDIYI